jgi:hypothetical protein
MGVSTCDDNEFGKAGFGDLRFVYGLRIPKVWHKGLKQILSVCLDVSANENEA